MIWGSWPSRSSSFLLCPCDADGPRGGRGRSAGCEFVRSSSRSCSPFVSIRRDFEFWLDEVSDGPQQRRTVRGCLADSPRAPRGRSVFLGSLLLVLYALTDGPRRRARQSVVLARTVRGSRPDGPRGQCGRSAPPGRMVRQSLCALLLGSIPPFFSCASACASRNRS
jgi:hypothetical protein